MRDMHAHFPHFFLVLFAVFYDIMHIKSEQYQSTLCVKIFIWSLIYCWFYNIWWILFWLVWWKICCWQYNITEKIIRVEQRIGLCQKYKQIYWATNLYIVKQSNQPNGLIYFLATIHTFNCTKSRIVAKNPVENEKLVVRLYNSLYVICSDKEWWYNTCKY